MTRSPWSGHRRPELTLSQLTARLLLPIITAALVWKLLAPGERFLPAFAKLLTDPKLERRPLSFPNGRAILTGGFQARSVAVRLQLKRSRHGKGNLVIAMQTEGRPTLDYQGIDVNARDKSGRQALAAIAAEELSISVEDGWLKAMWQPLGFVIFPGRFSEERWANVLQIVHALATSLDKPRP